jgi:hypothetical protein
MDGDSLFENNKSRGSTAVIVLQHLTALHHSVDFDASRNERVEGKIYLCAT